VKALKTHHKPQAERDKVAADETMLLESLTARRNAHALAAAALTNASADLDPTALSKLVDSERRAQSDVTFSQNKWECQKTVKAAICYNDFCYQNAVITFAASSEEKTALISDFMPLVYCTHACQAKDARKAKACVTEQCADGICGFEKKVLEPLRALKCPHLVMDEFSWVKWSKPSAVTPVPTLLEQARKAVREAATHKATLAALPPAATEVAFLEVQAKQIECLNRARKKSVLALKSLKKTMADRSLQKEKKLLAETQLKTANQLVRIVQNEKRLMQRSPSQRADLNPPPLFDEAEVSLPLPPNRGAYNREQKTGFVEFLVHLKSKMSDFFLHDFRRRWMEAQKREAEERLKPGEVMLYMDFSEAVHGAELVDSRRQQQGSHSVTAGGHRRVEG
jgi:hypothetical protein